jgi:hypothetical protein
MTDLLTELPEQNESLWMLTISPTIWVAHFLVCYLSAAIWCAKLAPANGSLWPVRLGIGVSTVLALIGIGITLWLGFSRHRLGTASVPHDFDTPEDRHRFLGFATVLLSALSAVAVLYVALAAVFIGSCV